MRVLWQYGLADGMYNTVYKSLFGLKPRARAHPAHAAV